MENGEEIKNFAAQNSLSPPYPTLEDFEATSDFEVFYVEKHGLFKTPN